MTTQLIRGIDFAYAERSSPLVFALTGRTGSGCTTAATSLSKPFSAIPLLQDEFEGPERRKLDIAFEYVSKHWSPFLAISVSTIIFSSLLEQERTAIEAFLQAMEVSSAGKDELLDNVRVLQADSRFPSFTSAMSGKATEDEKAAAWSLFSSEMSIRAQQVRKVLDTKYAPLFQAFGDNSRLSGTPLESTVQPEKLFVLMDRVRSLVECASAFCRSQSRPARVVIDAVRNPLELVYLRKHIANLYVLAITTDEASRRQRLSELGFRKKDIDSIDEKEYPEKKKHLDSYATFVSQNLRDCIQKADIFIANPGLPNQVASSVRTLNTQLVRYIALALRPGLVTPTRDERCMQIAFVAKLNSGCISRQVGAVVADSGYSIHALGWNDAPKGQTSCLLRDVNSLLEGADDVSFSEYERTDQKLRSHLEERFKNREALRDSLGLRCPFCFKDAYNFISKKDNQVHTRSLHAEENAFLQLTKRGGMGVGGGVLYTTASPCELCSKKAYQLGLREIIYVDPYPGISTNHVLKSGAADTQPLLRLFSGAVGHAYHRLYEPVMSVKDEYRVRLEETLT